MDNTSAYDIYISCCSSSGGIAHVKLSPDGSVCLCEITPMPIPMYAAIYGNSLYALLRKPLENDLSALICAGFDPSGALIYDGNMTCTGGLAACHLSVGGGYAYVANYASGSVAKIDLKTGSIISDLHTGCGIVPKRQDSPHAHFIAPSPDKKYILSTDLGTDTIYTYDCDLSKVSEAHVPKGSGARHLAYSDDGHYVYCVNELSSTVTVFSYSDGVLTAMNSLSTLGNCKSDGNTAAAVRLQGGRLYISNRGDDSISVFAANGGSLSFLFKSSCFGNAPRDFDFFGDFIVCANQFSNNVTVLKENNNCFEPVSEMSLDSPVCVVGYHK